MAVYKQTYAENFSEENGYYSYFDLEELYVYGSSRLGVIEDQASAEATNSFTAYVDGDGWFYDYCWGTMSTPTPCTTNCVSTYDNELG